VAYVTLLTKPDVNAMPLVAADGTHNPPFTFYDYTHALVHRLVAVAVESPASPCARFGVPIVIMATPDVAPHLRNQLVALDPSRVQVIDTIPLPLELRAASTSSSSAGGLVDAGDSGKGRAVGANPWLLPRSGEDVSRWMQSGTKLMAFGLLQFDRVLYVDSDSFFTRDPCRVFCDVPLVALSSSPPLGSKSRSEPSLRGMAYAAATEQRQLMPSPSSSSGKRRVAEDIFASVAVLAPNGGTLDFLAARLRHQVTPTDL
jgi:hypothetical protein